MARGAPCTPARPTDAKLGLEWEAASRAGRPLCRGAGPHGRRKVLGHQSGVRQALELQLDGLPLEGDASSALPPSSFRRALLWPCWALERGPGWWCRGSGTAACPGLLLDLGVRVAVRRGQQVGAGSGSPRLGWAARWPERPTTSDGPAVLFSPRHTFWQYRRENPHTKVGDPPPDGLPGFNSGVLLLDLEAMRRSPLYNRLLEPAALQELTEKYHFKGHLGDQDFFTLVGMEHPELFHVLDCTWNRQLCTWWKDHGYSDVFHHYYACEGPVKIYHGNCNTPIPDD